MTTARRWAADRLLFDGGESFRQWFLLRRNWVSNMSAGSEKMINLFPFGSDSWKVVNPRLLSRCGIISAKS